MKSYWIIWPTCYKRALVHFMMESLCSWRTYTLFSRLLHKVSEELSEWYFQDGRAVLAACCQLAVDNTEVRFTLVHVDEKPFRCVMVF